MVHVGGDFVPGGFGVGLAEEGGLLGRVSLTVYRYEGAEEETPGGQEEEKEGARLNSKRKRKPYQPRKIPTFIPRHIVIKHRHPIRRRLENRRTPRRVG